MTSRQSSPRTRRQGCGESSALVTAHLVNVAVKPDLVGEQQYGPARTSVSDGRGTTRTRRKASSRPLALALTVSALPALLMRMVTSRPAHPDTGATDQSDSERVTTAPTCGTPSDISTPALIELSASMCIDTGLVELLSVVKQEGHFNGGALREGEEKGVRAVVDEPVRGVAPRITGLSGRHPQ